MKMAAFLTAARMRDISGESLRIELAMYSWMKAVLPKGESVQMVLSR